MIKVPTGFQIIARSDNNIAAISHIRKIYGHQFHLKLFTLKGKQSETLF